MSDFKPTLTAEEKAYMRSLRLAIEPFRQMRPNLPLQYLYAFLLVAEQEGKSVNEYAEFTETPQSVMTRHLLDIGDRNRTGEEGFGLVTQERDRTDLRRHHARITPKGKAMVNRMITALRTLPKFNGT